MVIDSTAEYFSRLTATLPSDATINAYIDPEFNNSELFTPQILGVTLSVIAWSYSFIKITSSFDRPVIAKGLSPFLERYNPLEFDKICQGPSPSKYNPSASVSVHRYKSLLKLDPFQRATFPDCILLSVSKVRVFSESFVKSHCFTSVFVVTFTLSMPIPAQYLAVSNIILPSPNVVMPQVITCLENTSTPVDLSVTVNKTNLLMTLISNEYHFSLSKVIV